MKHTIVVAGVFMAVASPASADELVFSNNIWTDVAIGASSASYYDEFDGAELSVSGLSGDVRGSIGSFLGANRAIHASLGAKWLRNPDVEISRGKDSITAHTTGENRLLSLSVGGTRYYGPIGVTGRFGYATHDADSDFRISGLIYGAEVDYDSFPTASTRAGLGLALEMANLWSDATGKSDGDYISLGLTLHATFF